MKAYPSSARLTFRGFIKVGVFLLMIGVLGVGMAVIAGLFVLGDFSGTLQTEKAAAGAPHSKGLIPARYVAAEGDAPEGRVAKVAPASNADAVPAPLVAAPADAGSEPVRVARAIPVIMGDVPVRRAQPVLLTVSRAFDAQADVADEAFIPRARPVSPAEIANGSNQAYQLPAGSRMAQRGAVALNW
jgi:hypothetical protein